MSAAQIRTIDKRIVFTKLLAHILTKVSLLLSLRCRSPNIAPRASIQAASHGGGLLPGSKRCARSRSRMKGFGDSTRADSCLPRGVIPRDKGEPAKFSTRGFSLRELLEQFPDHPDPKPEEFCKHCCSIISCCLNVLSKCF